jgi:membrane associated rhomboid family serine protease
MNEQRGEDGQAQAPETPGREPVFLIPGVVSGLIGLLAAIYLAETFILNEEGRLALLYTFAFLPLRITAALEDIAYAIPLIWTPFTHALLHDGWEHLLVNTAWLAIFATPVARRYGTWPTLVIFFISAAAGAFAFALGNLQTTAYLLGASGGVSGLTGAAVRFIFQPVIVARHPETGERVVLGRRLASLSGVMREARARTFTLIWVVLNAAVPLMPALTGGMDVQIAWQAHLGGFFAGLLMVGLFERRSRPDQ